VGLLVGTTVKSDAYRAVMRIALLLVLLVASVHADPESIEQRVKRQVDRYRAAAGLPEVELDPTLGKGCMEHAEYLKRNRNTSAAIGLAVHRQRPNLRGASRAGALCAKGASVFTGVSDLDVAVDDWIAGLYHRRPILSPTLQRIGVGYAKLRDGSLMAVLGFVDSDDPSDSVKWPVAYPGDKQIDVRLGVSNEIPNPIPGGGWIPGRAGNPITWQFPPFDKVTGVKAELAIAGTAVPFYLSSPDKPATMHQQPGMVCLIPKVPLLPQTSYDVHVEAVWNGTPISRSWSFTTVALRVVDAHDETAVANAINVASTLRGRGVLAGWANRQIAFLQIGETKLQRFKRISILIPRAVWSKLGGAKLVGKTIEVDGLPYLVDGKYLNVPIATASQVRILNAQRGPGSKAE
jgi:uncharacterized protein YkwD